ncbi:MAG: 2OG-Fe(II) oxygenase [Alphaproteobacteria bacterium]
MTALDFDRLAAAPLATDPFEFVIVPGFVRADALAAILEGYPRIEQPGSYPLRGLDYGAAFAALLAELEGAPFRQAIEAKLGLELAGRPTMITLRGQVGERDGNIHKDSKSKIVTVLIYLNEPWAPSGGRLRLLRSAHDLEDYAVEVPPEDGLMLVFPCGERSFHGHKRFVGPRKVVQLNWMASGGRVVWNNLRHRLSAWWKRDDSAHRLAQGN